MTSTPFFEELHAFDITVISGNRPMGRTVDNTRHGRSSNGVLYVCDGEASFCRITGEVTVVKSGEALLIPAHSKYRMKYTSENTHFILVNFRLYDNGGRDSSFFDDWILLPRDERTNQIASIMAKFDACGASKTIGAALRKKELIYRLLGVLYAYAPSFSDRIGMDSRIADAVLLLEKSYLEDIPITKIAEASHISVTRFRSLFQKQFGISPLKYRNTLRIGRAEELLREGSLTVSEVAYASGFENVGYFCKCYKRIVGEAPGETRVKHQA